MTDANADSRKVLLSYSDKKARPFYLDVEVSRSPVRQDRVLVHLVAVQAPSAEYYLIFRSIDEGKRALLEGYTLTEEDYWRAKFEEARQLGDRAVEMPGGQYGYMPIRKRQEPSLSDVEDGTATLRVV